MKRPPKLPVKPGDQGQFVTSTLSMRQERLIGRIVIEWSKLEASLGDLVWHFLDLPIEYGRIITARMDANSITQTLRQLNKVAFEDKSTQSSLSEILDTLDILREDRNLIAHGTWGRVQRNLEGDQGGREIGIRLVPTSLSLKVKDTASTIVAEDFPEERLRVIVETIIKTKLDVSSMFESASLSFSERHTR